MFCVNLESNFWKTKRTGKLNAFRSFLNDFQLMLQSVPKKPSLIHLINLYTLLILPSRNYTYLHPPISYPKYCFEGVARFPFDVFILTYIQKITIDSGEMCQNWHTFIVPVHKTRTILLFWRIACLVFYVRVKIIYLNSENLCKTKHILQVWYSPVFVDSVYCPAAYVHVGFYVPWGKPLFFH